MCVLSPAVNPQNPAVCAVQRKNLNPSQNMFQGTYKDTRLTSTETALLSCLWPTLSMVLFVEALLEGTTQGIYERVTLLKTSGFFKLKYGIVLSQQNNCQQYSVCRKNLKLYEERLHYRPYSSSQVHKSMFRYYNKDIKILLALIPTLKKNVLSVGINPEVIAQNFSLKRFCQKL